MPKIQNTLHECRSLCHESSLQGWQWTPSQSCLLGRWGSNHGSNWPNWLSHWCKIRKLPTGNTHVIDPAHVLPINSPFYLKINASLKLTINLKAAKLPSESSKASAGLASFGSSSFSSSARSNSRWRTKALVKGDKQLQLGFGVGISRESWWSDFWQSLFGVHVDGIDHSYSTASQRSSKSRLCQAGAPPSLVGSSNPPALCRFSARSEPRNSSLPAELQADPNEPGLDPLASSPVVPKVSCGSQKTGKGKNIFQKRITTTALSNLRLWGHKPVSSRNRRPDRQCPLSQSHEKKKKWHPRASPCITQRNTP